MARLSANPPNATAYWSDILDRAVTETQNKLNKINGGHSYSGTPRLLTHEMRTPLQTGQLFPPQIPLFRVNKLYSAPLLSRLERFHHIKVTPKHILCTHTYNTKKDSNTKKCVHINYISTEN